MSKKMFVKRGHPGRPGRSRSPPHVPNHCMCSRSAGSVLQLPEPEQHGPNRSETLRKNTREQPHKILRAATNTGGSRECANSDTGVHQPRAPRGGTPHRRTHAAM
mmetsp:Transcript_19428/g.29804  ORF Transcript_19428/g.29804 Transcript_19428/m.29804 type:complete len:105 (-) Transcript_19428:390-704(-)